MNKYFGYAQCNECKDVEGPWILVNQRFLCESCYKKMIEKRKKEYDDELRMQLITSKTESSTMAKPIGLSCDFEVPTGQAALDSEITSPSLRD